MKEQEIQGILDQATQYFTQKEYEKCQALCEEVVKLDPYNERARKGLEMAQEAIESRDEEDFDYEATLSQVRQGTDRPGAVGIVGILGLVAYSALLLGLLAHVPGFFREARFVPWEVAFEAGAYLFLACAILLAGVVCWIAFLRGKSWAYYAVLVIQALNALVSLADGAPPVIELFFALYLMFNTRVKDFFGVGRK